MSYYHLKGIAQTIQQTSSSFKFPWGVLSCDKNVLTISRPGEAKLHFQNFDAFAKYVSQSI